MEVITNSASPFNINFIGASYNSYLINASNIYKERALIISLTVFVVLFALVTAALCVIIFAPKARAKFLKITTRKTPPSAKQSSRADSPQANKPQIKSAGSAAENRPQDKALPPNAAIKTQKAAPHANAPKTIAKDDGKKAEFTKDVKSVAPPKKNK